MTQQRDLTARQFGRWTVIRRGEPWGGKTHSRWLCRCDCGVERLVFQGSLLSRNSSSCGCWARENMSRLSSTHRLTKTPLYRIWADMIQRCENSKLPGYHRYGGRGITVCKEWRDSFETFARDMGPRPSRKHSVDRIKNDQGYRLGNCRWATSLEQQENTYRTKRIAFRGKTQSLRKWSEELRVPLAILRTRIKRKWSPERALTQIVQARGPT